MEETMEKKIVIIGAGLGGLSAGCYARMNGFDTEIYEMHDKPGGLCTSWDRRGYTIDYAIHDLSGPNQDSALNFLWQELGALQGLKMHYHDEFWRVETPEGEQVPMFCNIEQFGRRLKEIAPEDGAV
jgi:phytoene dehydrogenase-like protein